MPPGVAIGGAVLGSSLIAGRRARKESKRSRRALEAGKREGIEHIKRGFPKAQQYIRQAAASARPEIQRGFRSARGDIQRGFAGARRDIEDSSGRARGDIQRGYGEAQGFYGSPEMVQTQQELISRMLGKGGFSPQTTEQMKAGVREEYGTGLREAERALGSYYGESGAPGMAGENLAIAASQLGGDRGRAVRDIDIQNAMLQEQQQTRAIDTFQEQAYRRAGLSSEEAQILGNIEMQTGQSLAGLGTEQANILATLNAQEGQVLADIAAQMNINLANLTTDEATALANISIGTAAQQANIRTPDILTPLLTGAATGLASGYGQGLAKQEDK